MYGIPLFEQGDARDKLRQHCRRGKISIRTLDALVEAELEQVGKKRRAGLWDRFDELLGTMPSAETPPEED